MKLRIITILVNRWFISINNLMISFHTNNKYLYVLFIWPIHADIVVLYMRNPIDHLCFETYINQKRSLLAIATEEQGISFHS